MVTIGHIGPTARRSLARWQGPAGWLALSMVLTGTVLSSASMVDSALGAPGFWTWLLTFLQVLALYGAGTKRSWGWATGAAVQAPWIAYAVLTGQFGFIPGCAISAVVQAHSFLRGQPETITRSIWMKLDSTEVVS